MVLYEIEIHKWLMIFKIIVNFMFIDISFLGILFIGNI